MKQRTIIAMKGAPFTRKTEIATFIATSLSCPLLSIEDFLDITDPDEVQISIPVEDLAFKIICQIAKSHILKGVCDKIVIDSPLLSRFHFDQLIKLVESLKQTRLVVVECKPENKYSWQTNFENYVQRNRVKIESKWYKAKTWEDINKALIQDEYESRVSKLILDPMLDHLKLETEPLKSMTLYYLDEEELQKSGQPHPLIKAIEYMIARKNGVDSDLEVYYSKWRDCGSSGSVNTEYCRDGHTITKYNELGFDESKMLNCMGCGKEVKGSAYNYNCKNCSLGLHKECAEPIQNETNIMSFCDAAMICKPVSYCFSEKFACAYCKENKKPFSGNCMSCLFETNLKCRLKPAVIRHICHEKHFLSIVFLPEDCTPLEAYKCLACGKLVSKVFYSCKICSVYYHVNCITQIRRRVNDEHGGHHHCMQLKFSCEEAEDYHCDECLDRRDPQLWFYSCQDCKFDVHLDCIFKKNINIRPSLWRLWWARR